MSALEKNADDSNVNRSMDARSNVREHTQRFEIIGFCDSYKWPGTDDCTHFRHEHRFVSDHIPRQDALREYAERHGYYPSGKRGVIKGRCEPIYLNIGDGLDYVNCDLCCPRKPAIDNRVGPE